MDMKRLIETIDHFAGEPEQKPADQVRGTEVAKSAEHGKKHPFLHRLVGEEDCGCKEDVDLEESLRRDYKKFLEGYQVLPPLDKERHPERPGLEGPFRMKNGKVVYYDPKEGRYYDADSDIYLDRDEQLDEYGTTGTSGTGAGQPPSGQPQASNGQQPNQAQQDQQKSDTQSQQQITITPEQEKEIAGELVAQTTKDIMGKITGQKNIPVPPTMKIDQPLQQRVSAVLRQALEKNVKPGP